MGRACVALGARVPFAIGRALFVCVFDVVPCVPAPDLFEPYVNAVDDHATHRATIAIDLRTIGACHSSVRERGERLSCTLAIRLRTLGRIDAVKSNPILRLVGIQQCQRVAVGNSYHSAVPLG